VDIRVDREKMGSLDAEGSSYDLDALYIRHPVAQGLLSFKAGLLWVCTWSLAALAGAYLLRPVCALIFLLSALLEITYCLLLKVSHLRIIVSGMVKSAGALAAVFAVDPRPELSFLMLLFGLVFFWEIGGQNIPNDWADVKSDRLLGAKTVPVLLGLPAAGIIAVSSNALAVIFSIMMSWVVPALRSSVYLIGVLLTGMVILILPSCRLYRIQEARRASELFNKASFYPVLVFTLVLICLVL
jgi:4-hydroxybenzoate polyprenyltransferase